MEFRLLGGKDVGAAEGLAYDEALMEHYGRDDEPRDPTLRLYNYRAHAGLVGRYQNLGDELDVEFCRAHDIAVGRRPTGGGAIIMGPGQLGVAVTSRAMTDKTPREMLQYYAGGVIAGLRALGIEASFRKKNDLEVDGKKIAGLGLYFDPRGAVLFHSSVLADLDIALMLQVLQIPGAKLSDKAVARVGERVTTISRELDAPRVAADVRDAFRDGFLSHFEATGRVGEITDAEAQRYDALVTEKYQSDEWVFQRTPQRDARGTALLKTPGGLVRLYVGVQGESIKSVLVTGDFNVLPPGLTALESALKWSRASRDRVHEAVTEHVQRDDLGVEPAQLADSLWEATRNAVELQSTAHPVYLDGACYAPKD